ncbi:hypothetical protein B0T24DRAFT_681090 [Lasiosphaeria ovina]|uniref:Uncharacterized protein n=1 Tax=Lasiosphaeria ovina TaxID=92902 RepID=A0AAE0K3Q3_9PEZI|nr:hypothetical protein B0T24DRAFT_681090 [Lasiosphaeria ovina]
MAAGGRIVRIPRAFNWLLPVQGFVAAVIIYSSIYIFHVGAVPFILAVIGAGLHFVLGLYFCFTQNRLGSYHLYIVPPWLLICAGVWCACLYYFTIQVDYITKFPHQVFRAADGTVQNDVATWSKVGLATSALDIFIDLALLAIFILGVVRHTPRQAHQPGSFISTPVYQAPPGNPQYQYEQPQPQSQYSQQQQAHQYQQQYQQQYPQQTPAPPLDLKNAVPTATASPRPITTAPSQRYPYDRSNRIDVIKRLCAVQHPDGHWDYSAELAELVKLWGGRELGPTPQGATALTHACLTDLCTHVWAAQRDGREHAALTSAELASLQLVNWDLSWAGNALERATAWMGGYR